jgi:hypothetical protein
MEVVQMIDWYVEGIQFGTCNCAYGCPCQFEALPTHGHCEGFEAVQIDKGHFGDVDLSGTMIAALYAWPGPIFEGGGQFQAIIGEGADEQQRDALTRLLHGEETQEAATHWWVFHAMSDTVHETLVRPIEFEADIESRTARVVIPGMLESVGEPIRSPVDGAEHRVRIDIPDGIEFEFAEMASGKTHSTGAIPLDQEKCFAQLSRLRHSGNGVYRD